MDEGDHLGHEDEAGAAFLLGRHVLQRQPARDQAVGVERRHRQVGVPVRHAVVRTLLEERVLVQAEAATVAACGK